MDAPLADKTACCFLLYGILATNKTSSHCSC
nr:MAG TPA: hypothetical protein [Caudoviricetes sp.]